MMTRRCLAKGCSRIVAARFLMCSRHWRMVPADLQSGIWSAYREGQEDDGLGHSQTYVDATTAAVDAVASIEAGRPRRSTAPAPGQLDFFEGDSP